MTGEQKIKLWRRVRLDVRVWLGLLGVMVLTIATQALVGYIFGNVALYTWSEPIGMALNTAIEFFLCGVGFILLSLSEEIWT